MCMVRLHNDGARISEDHLFGYTKLYPYTNIAFYTSVQMFSISMDDDSFTDNISLTVWNIQSHVNYFRPYLLEYSLYQTSVYMR